MKPAGVFFMIASLLCSGLAKAQSAQQWRDSLSVLNRQIDTSPYSSDLHLRKAAVNLELGQWEYAIEEYDFVLKKEPDNIAALFYRAYANVNMRRFEQARDDYEAVLQRASYNMEARLGLAYVYTKLNRPGEAMDEINKTVEMFPDSATAYAARAVMEREQKAYAAALYDWEQAARLCPGNIDYKISQVDILLLMNNKREARSILDKMVREGTPRGLLREWYEKCSK